MEEAFGPSLLETNARLAAERRVSASPSAKQTYEAMKTVEESKRGLPSFETDWPKDLEKKHDARPGGPEWASQRFHQMMQSSLRENTWRGFQGYDSPLAG